MIRFEFEERGTERSLRFFRNLQGNVENLSPLMGTIAQDILKSVHRNFNEGGRPKEWKELSPNTEKKRRNLVRKATLYQSGNLFHSIAEEHTPNMARVFTRGVPYAGIHQYGGITGRGHSSVIPARPYMLFQEEDIINIMNKAHDYLMKVKA